MGSYRNSNSSKPLCISLLPAGMNKIRSKPKGLECSQHFSHFKSMGIFPDDQEQLTPQSNVRILNSLEMLWMSLLSARIKKIRSKMKAPKSVHNFFAIIPLSEQSVVMETRLLIRSDQKPNAAFSHTPMMLQIKFDCDRPSGCGDIHL